MKKIKSILAISAFAASMSAFAGSAPVAPTSSGKQSPRASTDRQSIRTAVRDFHEQHAAAQGVKATTEPPMPAPRAQAAASEDAGHSAAVRREHGRKSASRQEQRQAWAEQRELVNESKHSRKQKRLERQQHKHEHVDVVAQAPSAPSATH